MTHDKEPQLDAYEPYFKTETVLKNTYYKFAFERIIIKEGKFRIFNWAAFFLGPLWLVYRRMYGIAFLWDRFRRSISKNKPKT